MAFDLASVRTGTRELPPRIVLAGVEKVGKSTFAAQAPSPIIAPIKGEQGIDALDTASFPTVNTFDELCECIGTLANEKHDYETFAIDSASALEPLVWAKTCEENGNAASIEKVNGGYGKGYIEAMKYWRMVMDGLDALRDRGMTTILICHVKVKPFNDPLSDPYDSYIIDLQERAAAGLFRWADSILFAGKKVMTKDIKGKGDSKVTHGVGGDRSVLYTSKRAGIPAGGRGRYGHLPPELELTWNDYAAAIAAAE